MMHSLLQTRWSLLLLIPMILTIQGCNTMSGAGQDLEAAGAGLEKSAEQEKGY